MQKLDVAKRLFPLVLTGEKTSTIRFNEQRIHAGPMTYWCDGSFVGMAAVEMYGKIGLLRSLVIKKDERS
ncbi:MAG: hypothetical protein COA74_12815 [Gammaproteobacteria bacterium]|nr:MAG: hypothetical protein COA74_12815 [Gammaproteobacteria bacterium]